MPARRRGTFVLHDIFPASLGHCFGVMVESVGGTPTGIVVETSLYWGVVAGQWRDGMSAPGIVLPGGVPQR